VGPGLWEAGVVGKAEAREVRGSGVGRVEARVVELAWLW
jgi:hypothetical protein